MRERYVKSEHLVPMRDGVRLFTTVYAPRNAPVPAPILFTRTPYSVAPYGEDRYREALGPSRKLAEDGFFFVYQDVRGRNRSEGTFVHVRPRVPEKRSPAEIDESSDAYDTIEWLLANLPGHNGRVGMWGVSYPGFYAAMGMIDAHSALKAVSPQAPIGDWFVGDDFHHNGALFLAHAFNFLVEFDRPSPASAAERDAPFRHGTPDGYRFFLELGPLANAEKRHFPFGGFFPEMLRHPRYDEFWKARDVRPHLRGIRPAVLTVGGWYDAEDLFGALQVYAETERSNPGASNRLVMGPWAHGGWARSDGDALGRVRFGTPTAVHYREQIEAPFFLSLLKGDGAPPLPEASVFETGANRWRSFDAWPPPAAKPLPLYLGAGGALILEPPNGPLACDEFRSDPSRPVPFIDSIAVGMTRDYMVGDQRFASRRPDVLVYRTEPLQARVTVAGPIRATLRVSTTGTDADWVVKLVDVYPDDFPDPDPNPAGVRMGGFEQLVRGEPFRGRFRAGFERPVPFRPGALETVEFTMPDVFHTFLPGHRIMVHVQGSWFPLVDRNPQSFVDPLEAKESDFVAAVHRIWRGGDRSSRILLPVLPE